MKGESVGFFGEKGDGETKDVSSTSARAKFKFHPRKNGKRNVEK